MTAVCRHCGTRLTRADNGWMDHGRSLNCGPNWHEPEPVEDRIAAWIAARPRGFRLGRVIADLGVGAAEVHAYIDREIAAGRMRKTGPGLWRRVERDEGAER